MISFKFLLKAVFICIAVTTAAAQTPPEKPFSESDVYKPDLSRYSTKKEKKQRGNRKEAGERVSSIQSVQLNPETWLSFNAFDQLWSYVTDIKADEVEVFLNNEPRKIEVFQADSRPLDIVFLVDMSPSVTNRIAEVSEWLLEVGNSLRSEDRITLIAFASDFKVMLDSTTDRSAFGKAVCNLKIDSGTSLYEAIERLTLLSSWMDGRKTVLLVSDGVDTTSKKVSLNASLMMARDSNVEIHPIYLDTFQPNAKQSQDSLRQLRNMNVPSYILDRLNNVTEVAYRIGREYLTFLLRFTGGSSFVFPAVGTSIGDDAKRVANALKLRYELKIDPEKIPSAGSPAEIRIRVRRPRLTIATRGWVSPPSNNR
jgi:VWFA-related protein